MTADDDRESKSMADRSGKNSGGIKGFLFGVASTLVVIGVGSLLYLRFGDPPVAVADQPFPDEEQIVHIALDARIDRQLSKAPFSPSSSDLIAGANIYMRQCAVCHGTPVRRSDLVKNMYPRPPQLWEKKNEHGTVGVSDNAPGRIYWEVKNGIRLTGMPSFAHLLDDQQLWQVSLLVKQAGQALPAEATATLDSTSGVTQLR